MTSQLHPERQIGATCPACESFPLVHAPEDKTLVYCTNPTCLFEDDRDEPVEKRRSTWGQVADSMTKSSNDPTYDSGLN